MWCICRNRQNRRRQCIFALLHGACVGDVDGIKEDAFGAVKLLGDELGTSDEGTVALHRCMKYV